MCVDIEDIYRSRLSHLHACVERWCAQTVAPGGKGIITAASIQQQCEVATEERERAVHRYCVCCLFHSTLVRRLLSDCPVVLASSPCCQYSAPSQHTPTIEAGGAKQRTLATFRGNKTTQQRNTQRSTQTTQHNTTTLHNITHHSTAAKSLTSQPLRASAIHSQSSAVPCSAASCNNKPTTAPLPGRTARQSDHPTFLTIIQFTTLPYSG